MASWKFCQGSLVLAGSPDANLAFARQPPRQEIVQAAKPGGGEGAKPPPACHVEQTWPRQSLIVSRWGPAPSQSAPHSSLPLSAHALPPCTRLGTFCKEGFGDTSASMPRQANLPRWDSRAEILQCVQCLKPKA